MGAHYAEASRGQKSGRAHYRDTLSVLSPLPELRLFSLSCGRGFGGERREFVHFRLAAEPPGGGGAKKGER